MGERRGEREREIERGRSDARIYKGNTSPGIKVVPRNGNTT